MHILLAYMLVGALTLALAVAYSTNHARTSRSLHAVAYDRSTSMIVAMVMVILTWPVALGLALLAKYNFTRSFQTTG